MIDWSTLHDAYGPAHAIPGLLDRAIGRDQEAIDGLWGRLCHQGTITPASIAALPQLADIAKTEGAGDWALDLAGAIAGGLLQPHGADEEVARRAATLSELRALAAARLRPGLTGKMYLKPAAGHARVRRPALVVRGPGRLHRFLRHCRLSALRRTGDDRNRRLRLLLLDPRLESGGCPPSPAPAKRSRTS